MSVPCSEYPSDDAPRLCPKGHSICWSRQRCHDDQEAWLGMCLFCAEIVYGWYNGEVIINDEKGFREE